MQSVRIRSRATFSSIRNLWPLGYTGTTALEAKQEATDAFLMMARAGVVAGPGHAWESQTPG